MSTFFVVVLHLSVVLFVVGMIKPRWVVRWGLPEQRTRKKVAIVYLGLMFGSFLMVGLTAPDTTGAKKEVVKQDKRIPAPEAKPPVNTADKALLPGISDFIKQRVEYGTVTSTDPQPDWADGKRQQVNTTTGRYLFYTYKDEVVGVYKYNSDGSRTRQFHKDIPQLPQNIEKAAEGNIPEYKIISQMNLIGNKGKWGDIVIPSYSKNTPKDIREATLRQICQREGFVGAALYSTEEAYKANVSASYAQNNPGALKAGFLGSLRDGSFTAAE